MRRPRAPSSGCWLFAFGQLRRNFSRLSVFDALPYSVLKVQLS
jgi:hypothetical protein